MGIVAVSAVDQPFLHSMMSGLGKIRLHFDMAAIAQCRLRCSQKGVVDCGRMYGMAIRATYIVLQVLRAQEIGMFFAKFMAAKTPFRSLFP